MKAGMLKVTTEDGALWLQCEKVIYVREEFSTGADEVSSVVAFVGGKEIRCKESARWIRHELCPTHE